VGGNWQSIALARRREIGYKRAAGKAQKPFWGGGVGSDTPMNRSCLSFALVVVLLAAVVVRPATASSLDADTVKAALHTATPDEGAFIDKVLAKVDKGALPLDLVESTFLWAKKKPRNKFQYFKRALIFRAAQQGISL
jgi:hypothetical protein